MMQQKTPQRRRGARAGGSVRQFLRDRRGAVSPIMVLCLIPLIGALAMGTETSSWWLLRRNLQNAADSAVLAAAATNDTTSSCSSSNPGTYYCEAIAAAAEYGFTNGSGNVTVTPAYLTSGCPGGASACYEVTVSKTVPLYLTEAVGYHGTGGTNSQTVTAVAYSSAVNPRTYCILALAGSGAEGITSNGAPDADLGRCNIMSDTSATCHGHNLGAAIGDAHGKNDGCGIEQNSNVPAVADPYSGLASNIPNFSATSCGTAGISGNTITTTPLNLPPSCTFVGDVTLPAGQTVVVNTPPTASGGSVIYIKDGTLNLNGGTLQTASGSGLTIVFTGSGAANGVSYYPTGGGTLDIAAPKGGTWSGVALYQDPSMPAGSGVNVSYAGNSPTWDITGLVYLPHSSVTFSGAVNKSNNGYSCFDLVVDNVTFNGTADILADEGQCNQAGLTMPGSPHENAGLIQ